MRIIFLFGVVCLFSFQLHAIETPSQISSSDSLLIENEETLEKISLVKGEKIKIKLKNGDRVKGNITNLETESIWVDDVRVSLSAVEFISKPNTKRKEKIEAASMLALGGAGMIGGFSLTIYFILISIAIGEPIILIFGLLGLAAMALGFLLLRVGRKWVKSAWKKFKPGQKFQTKLK